MELYVFYNNNNSIYFQINIPLKKKSRELFKTSFTCNYEMYLQVVKAFMDNL